MTERQTFAGLVRPDVAWQAGFEYGEPGSMDSKGENLYYIYNGFIPDITDSGKGLHIVVGERLALTGTKRAWYFGTLEGPDFLYMTAEENQNHQQMVLDILVRKNRVAGRKLESLIHKVMESALSKIPSQSPA